MVVTDLACVTMYDYFHARVFVNSLRFAFFLLKAKWNLLAFSVEFIDLGFACDVILDNHMSVLRQRFPNF